MSALYFATYEGQASSGNGVFYIGGGIVAGADVIGGKYLGTYTETGGRLRGSVKMTAPPGGGSLVTGLTVPGNASFDLSFDFPQDFASGQPQTLTGPGNLPVRIRFEKIRDLPLVARAA
jgi:hypothetical protein